MSSSAPAPVSHIVAIGASAGGLDALERLFDNLSCQSGAAFVVIQHLSPDHKSMMANLLSRHTAMPVYVVEQDMLIEPNQVYLIPPGAIMHVSEGHLRLTPKNPRMLTLPIDVFFSSLASQHGAGSVGVILSGTGSDGTRGAPAINAGGGVLIAQEPEEAKFDGMPRSVIATGLVDAILPVAQIGPRLLAHILKEAFKIPEHVEQPVSGAATAGADSALAGILLLLQQLGGIDFNEYKPGTVMRRIERRMTVCQVGSLEIYLDRLKQDRNEVLTLRRELLIPVSSFFRDADAFDALSREVIDPLVSSKQTGESIRVWAAAVSTGEEAYSLAMLFMESFDRLKRWPTLKIFATDVEQHNIEAASSGSYPESIGAEVSPLQLERFFTKKDGSFVVRNELRQCIVFARHNMLSDPPFTKMDLVVCRNALIYFRSFAQERALKRFQYALVPNGYLFQGSSESLGVLQPDFLALSARHKIWQVIRPVGVPMDMSQGTRMVVGAGHTRPAAAATSRRPAGMPSAVERGFATLLKAFSPPPSVMVNARHELVHSYGDVRSILGLREGQASLSLNRVLPEELISVSAAMLYKAEREQSGISANPVCIVDAKGVARQLRLSAWPVGESEGERLTLLVFETDHVHSQEDGVETIDVDAETVERIQLLERELGATRESLQATIEELETSNEELQATNEEMMASNEELQSSNEELQSVNKELNTVNAEYQEKIEIMNRLAADLKSMTESVAAGTIFVDHELQLTRFSPELELQNEELRRAQQEAELSNVRFQALFKQLPMASMVIDANGMLQRCNERCTRLLGTRKNHALHDNRRFRALSRTDRTRLHEALRLVAIGEPVVLQHIEPALPDAGRMVFDAHLMRLSNIWHLDGHAMVLLVDRSAEATLEQDRHLFSLLLDSSDALIYATDTDGKMLVANHALLDSLGRNRDEVLGQHRELFLPLREALVHRSTDEAVLRTGESLTLEEQIQADGQSSPLDFFTRKFPLHDLQGNTYGVAGISTDITEMKMRQRQALLSESVFVAASEAILITDQDNRIVRVNPAFTAMSGFSESSVVGHRPSILKSGRQDASFFSIMWEALHTTGKWAGELSNRAADGTIFTVWSSINVIRDENGRIMHYMAIQTDVTRLREAQVKVEQLASYDSLTGLPNRTLFNDRISQLIAHAQRYDKTFAVLFVDLDHFKEINDSLGHQVGDDLLKMIARRLLDGVRSEDTVARMGGDEFVVILPSADHATVQRVADKLLDTLRAPMPLGPLMAYQPQASIGIAVYSFDGTNTDMLLRNADIAMYAAKLAGRNRSTVYDAKMSEDNARVFAIQTELSAGIGRQELRLYFQPKFRLDSGELEGAEALVRWERPGHGLLSPAEFIPIAEKSGLVVAIDHWVLKESLRQIGQWQDDGLWKKSWRIAVNHSASDLRRPEMIVNLKSMFREFCIAASMLELEITEGALLENTKETIQRLTELKDMGVSLAIDDFGTGYSSLAYLRKLPISVIKIDRSFINEMLVNENGRILVETIIAMAHKLGHRLVAEGVEDAAQRDCLAALGCEVGQGYLFGRPVDAEAFEAAYLSAVPVS